MMNHNQTGESAVKQHKSGRLRRGWAGAVAFGVAALGLTMAPSPAVGAAEITMVPQDPIGGSGHAGLYGWGAATMKDGSVLVGDYWNMRVLRFTEDGANPTVFINNPGFGAEQHLSPYGLAVDPDTGDVYMADTDRRQVDRYSSTGQYLNSLGTNGVVGETPSTLRYPSRVAVHDGLVFVADTWAHRISVWAPNGRTPDGQQQQLWEYKAFGGKDGQFRQPRGMAFDTEGRLHVVDSGNKRVQVFDVDAVNKRLVFRYKYGAAFVAENDPAGRVIRGDMRGLAIDDDRGLVYVVDAEGNRIHTFTTAGAYVRTWGGASTFSDGGREATVDHHGHLWVGDMPGFRVQIFEPDGTHLRNYPDPPQPPPPGRFNGPRGVAVDPTSGDLFVSDTYNFRVQRLAADGASIDEWGTRGRSEFEFNYTRLLAVDPTDGSVIITDTDNHRIKKYTKDGVFVWEIGKLGADPLLFRNPHGIDIGPDGTIYVADTNNQRVQVIAQDGTWLDTIGAAGSGNGQFRRPRGVVADDVNGDIYVADANRKNVQVFTKDGVYKRTFGVSGTGPGSLEGPFDVAVDDTYLYVADTPRNVISVWRKDGAFVGAFGGGGKANGKLLQPQGLDLVGDMLYVAEQENERISKWKVFRGELVPDTTKPTSVQSAPTVGQNLSGRPVLMTGTATDDSGVKRVELAVQDRVTKQWWNPVTKAWQTGRTAQCFGIANLGASNATETTWSYTFDDRPRPSASGQYLVQRRAVDTSNNVETIPAGVRFNVVG
jgi:DNA-binding beta-propeller fold protein YncE